MEFQLDLGIDQQDIFAHKSVPVFYTCIYLGYLGTKYTSSDLKFQIACSKTQQLGFELEIISRKSTF
ncbi:hypothetical protein OIU74_018469 [Salix koriyanagi]|uniref:Uncharacterized protein n=1 Tax=Salix koriyanagi TaxID=2511006 RepID=A0A9Q1AI27_9ROSI|nr:hypothetical protein OIU74_018469 [Salix koriyanagi]